jgi:hypothetical protein
MHALQRDPSMKGWLESKVRGLAFRVRTNNLDKATHESEDAAARHKHDHIPHD